VAFLRDIRKCRVCGGYTEEYRHCGRETVLLLPANLRLKLSKLISGILRHFPEQYGVKLDSGGYARIDDLVEGIRRKGYSWLTAEHVIAIVMLDPKGRFELKDGLIRARYGHSVKVKLEFDEEVHEGVLYHGTTVEALKGIRRKGILPMKRLMVHLSGSFEAAKINALRKKGRHVVLEIDVKKLVRLGHKVYRASRDVYVTDYVPPSCIRRIIHID